MCRIEFGSLGADPSVRIAAWPRPEPGARYLAVLGGTATLGKSVAQPFPTLLSRAAGLQVLNLAALNGGPDVYLSNPALLALVARAELAVVQLTGAETVSNPFYTVHSRRNDRFLAATPALRALYPELDVTEIHFARHLLQVLASIDAGRFSVVVRSLQFAWVARMQSLLAQLPRRRRLLWLSEAPPPARADRLEAGPGPLFIDSAMLESLRPLGGEAIIAVPSPGARVADAAGLPGAGSTGTGLPGQAAHREIAALLAPLVAAPSAIPPLLLRQPAADP